MSKKKLLIIVPIVIVVAIGTWLYAQHRQHEATCRRSFIGECLPAGQCPGPTDGVIYCETGKDVVPGGN